jgi:hypothetical protein
MPGAHYNTHSKGDVFVNAPVFNEPEILKDYAQRASVLRHFSSGNTAHIITVYDYFALCAGYLACKKLYNSRFAAA